MSESRLNVLARPVTINTATERRLWMDSGGHCANPACRAPLWNAFDSGEVANLSDLAHIIARSRQGPRGAEDLSNEERDAYRNLVILCPRCHRLVDSAPAEHPEKLLRDWKNSRINEVRRGSAVTVGTREELRGRIRRLLDENAAIHRSFGPEAGSGTVLELEAARLWRQQLLRVILPNNRAIYQLLSANEGLLNERERDTVQRFYAHMVALELNHLGAEKNAFAPTFPEDMDALLEEGA